jgi:hypothetical protein
MSQGCRYHLAGPLTIIINGPFGRDNAEISLAILFCRDCGQAHTNDQLVLENMNAAGKTALNSILARLPSGKEIVNQLFPSNMN